jgi:hypothetical protein
MAVGREPSACEGAGGYRVPHPARGDWLTNGAHHTGGRR